MCKAWALDPSASDVEVCEVAHECPLDYVVGEWDLVNAICTKACCVVSVLRYANVVDFACVSQ